MIRAVTVLVVLTALLAPAAASADVDSRAAAGLATNGTIWDVREIGDRVFAGGGFTRAGRMTGPASELDLATGAARPGLPRVQGIVRAIESDGAGGWYLGGEFDRVGSDERHNLAHVLADGTVDPAFRASDMTTSGHGVYALARVGSRLLVGGIFEEIGGVARHGLAELDEQGRATAWDPRLHTPNGPGGAALALVVDGDRVLVGGAFSAIGGVARPGLAALRTSDLASTAFAPPEGGRVAAIVRAGDRVYAGGDLVGQQGVAAYAQDTGALLPWRPTPAPTGGVRALAEAAGTVYVGGQWPVPGGGADAVVPLAGFDRTSGARVWLPALGPNIEGNLGPGLPAVNALEVADGDLLIAGRFRKVDDVERDQIARFDAATRAVRGWTSDANGDVNALARGPDGSLAAAGSFTGVGLERRIGLAAFATSDGSLLDWDADLNMAAFPGLEASTPGVTDLDAAGGLLYVTGLFHGVGPDVRHKLAAIDPLTARATGWAPESDSPGSLRSAPTRVIVDDDRVYVTNGDTLNGTRRAFLGALSRSTGALLPWDPKPNPGVTDVVRDGGRVLLVGNFSAIGDPPVPRNGAAAVDRASAAVLGWAPALSGSGGSPAHVEDALPIGDRVYLTGRFTAAGGAPRSGFAAVDALTGAALAFDPPPTITGVRTTVGLYRLARIGDRFYVTGNFNYMGPQVRINGTAAFDTASGALDPWFVEDSCTDPGSVTAGTMTLYVLSWAACFDGKLRDGDHVGFYRDAGTPAARTAPQLGGRGLARRLTCSEGTYSGNGPLDLSYAWLRDGVATAATGSTYEVQQEDGGHVLGCRVTARRGSVQIVQDSDTIRLPILPPLIGQASVQGGPSPRCIPGTLLGSTPVTYLYEWLIGNGTVYATGQDLVYRGDLPTPELFRCRVTVTNAAGSSSAVSFGGVVFGGTARPPTLSPTLAPTPTATPTPAPAPARTTFRASAGKLTRGVVRVQAASNRSGTVRLRLRLGRAVLGRSTAALVAGRRATLRVKLSKRGAATLQRARRPRLVAVVHFTPGGGAPITRTLTVRLR